MLFFIENQPTILQPIGSLLYFTAGLLMIFLSLHKNCSLFSSGNKLISMFYLLCHIRYLQSVFLLPLYSTRSPVFPRKSHGLSSLDGYLLSRGWGHTPISPLPPPPPGSRTEKQDRGMGSPPLTEKTLCDCNLRALFLFCFCSSIDI